MNRQETQKEIKSLTTAINDIVIAAVNRDFQNPNYVNEAPKPLKGEEVYAIQNLRQQAIAIRRGYYESI